MSRGAPHLADESSSDRKWFRTTQWNVVLSTGDTNCSKAAEAREKLCAIYWTPLYNFVCRSGHNSEDAKDLTQSFFAKLVEKDFWTRADPLKGRFRAFLLTALRQFLLDERDRARAAKRGGGAPIQSLDESGLDLEIHAVRAGECAGDKQFDRQWAAAVLVEAKERLRQECIAVGKGELYDRIDLLSQKTTNPVGYAEIAAELGTTVSAIKSSVPRWRHRYAELVREEVAQTVSDPADIDSEIAYLLSIVTE
jgi:RNA polymerase sigma-70 factor (ECF subfamily)